MPKPKSPTYTEGDFRAVLRHLAEIERSNSARLHGCPACLNASEALDHYAGDPHLASAIAGAIARRHLTATAAGFLPRVRPASQSACRRLARHGEVFAKPRRTGSL